MSLHPTLEAILRPFTFFGALDRYVRNCADNHTMTTPIGGESGRMVECLECGRRFEGLVV